jgi:hypothetical protein
MHSIHFISNDPNPQQQSDTSWGIRRRETGEDKTEKRKIKKERRDLASMVFVREKAWV